MINTAHADTKYFEECGKDKKVDKWYLDPANCITTNRTMPVIAHNMTTIHESLPGILSISTRQLVNLVAYNQTLLDGRFLVDVNPTCSVGHRVNTIDARMVDTRTGYLMDITGLTQTDPRDARGYCKSPHGYSYKQIFPLVETMLEGVKVRRLRAVMAIIVEEYQFKALASERHSTWGEGIN
ncbi:hypothetical protein HK100_007714 [Physocladia obscura]|uniref:Uncharacterized protein n=1 Tax=Physocladia obscura TaxID=109957 RepID=A0AAD5SQA9_9FUNG|nr:hypothetical protein HK100_007714 [Physocladia obscura]